MDLLDSLRGFLLFTKSTSFIMPYYNRYHDETNNYDYPWITDWEHPLLNMLQILL
jgi:hypothetical protein